MLCRIAALTQRINMAPYSLMSGMTHLPLSVFFFELSGRLLSDAIVSSKNGGLTVFVTHKNHSMSLVLFGPVFLFKIKKI